MQLSVTTNVIVFFPGAIVNADRSVRRGHLTIQLDTITEDTGLVKPRLELGARYDEAGDKTRRQN
jgi:hypothetical protein